MTEPAGVSRGLYQVAVGATKCWKFCLKKLNFPQIANPNPTEIGESGPFRAWGLWSQALR